jgi:GntR family transcriptional regulator
MSEIPIYQQLYNQIVSQILSGDLKSGTNLPSIRVMAKELRVSVITIKKTWEELEKSGYLYTISGKGTYISALTEKNLEIKKDNLLKELFSKNISQCKTLNISKEEIFVVINDLYNDIN